MKGHRTKSLPSRSSQLAGAAAQETWKHRNKHSHCRPSDRVKRWRRAGEGL